MATCTECVDGNIPYNACTEEVVTDARLNGTKHTNTHTRHTNHPSIHPTPVRDILKLLDISEGGQKYLQSANHTQHRDPRHMRTFCFGCDGCGWPDQMRGVRQGRRRRRSSPRFDGCKGAGLQVRRSLFGAPRKARVRDSKCRPCFSHFVFVHTVLKIK